MIVMKLITNIKSQTNITGSLSWYGIWVSISCHVNPIIRIDSSSENAGRMIGTDCDEMYRHNTVIKNKPTQRAPVATYRVVSTGIKTHLICDEWFSKCTGSGRARREQTDRTEDDGGGEDDESNRQETDS